jgi:hypothetical protein
MALESLSYKTLQWLVFVFLALHNLEEGLTAPAYIPEIKNLLSGRVPDALLASLPTPGQFYAALLGATVVPLALIAFATTGRPTPFKSYLVVAVQAVVFLNVFVPHVPAAVALGGYAPGVFTAVLINLPFSLIFFRRSLDESRVRPAGLALVLALALPALVLSVFALYALGGSLALGRSAAPPLPAFSSPFSVHT